MNPRIFITSLEIIRIEGQDTPNMWILGVKAGDSHKPRFLGGSL